MAIIGLPTFSTMAIGLVKVIVILDPCDTPAEYREDVVKSIYSQ